MEKQPEGPGARGLARRRDPFPVQPGGRKPRALESMARRTAMAAALACSIAFAASSAACGAAGGSLAPPANAAGAAATSGQPGDGPAKLDAASPGAAPGSGSAALLVEGSIPVRGLPGLGRNALSGLAGVYSIPAGGSSQGSLRVKVWYTGETLLLPEGLSDPGCKVTVPGFKARSTGEAADGSELWFMSAAGYTLIAEFPQGFVDPCAFAAKLMDRFAFFKGYAARPEDISFPASLELGR